MSAFFIWIVPCVADLLRLSQKFGFGLRPRDLSHGASLSGITMGFNPSIKSLKIEG